MNIVVDASLVVDALVDQGSRSIWSENVIRGHALSAPQMLHAEAVNVLRRLERDRVITTPQADIAHDDLVQMPIVPFAFTPLAARIWELRHNLTSYDAWYVALAESLDCPLATLDYHLARAPGPRCAFLTPGTLHVR